MLENVFSYSGVDHNFLGGRAAQHCFFREQWTTENSLQVCVHAFNAFCIDFCLHCVVMIDYRQWEEWLLCWSGEARPAIKYGWVKIYLMQACVQTFACLMPWFSTLLSRHFEIVRFRFTVFYPQVFCLKQHLFPSRRGFEWTTHIFHSSHNRYLSFTRADQPLEERRLMKKRLGLDRNNEEKDSAVNEVINDGQCGNRGMELQKWRSVKWMHVCREEEKPKRDDKKNDKSGGRRDFELVWYVVWTTPYF